MRAFACPTCSKLVYPFVLAPVAVEKLRFAHGLMEAA
jgi:hypothetical protein